MTPDQPTKHLIGGHRDFLAFVERHNIPRDQLENRKGVGYLTLTLAQFDLLVDECFDGIL